MPSPFPGMDPYLEGSLWTTIHHTLATEIVRQLAPRLRPRYVALPEERFVIDDWGEDDMTTSDVYPDLGVIEPDVIAAVGTMEANPPAPPLLATTGPSSVPHVSIEIRDTSRRRLVTAIEILSPTNKRGEGRKDYLTRRQRILRSTAHLLEIDLLRKGRRVPVAEDLPPKPYFVFLSRAENRLRIEIWPIALDEPLPTVPVPLLPGDDDVSLELQRVLTSAYDLVGYDLVIDYTQPPEIALTPEEAAWASGFGP